MAEMVFNNTSKSYIPMLGQTFYEFCINSEGKKANFKFWNNADRVEKTISKAKFLIIDYLLLRVHSPGVDNN